MISKNLLLLSSIIFVFLFVASSTPVFSQTSGRIELSRNKIRLPCPPTYMPNEGLECGKDLTIVITAFHNNFKKDDVTFVYTVTGGQIIGNGSKVFWNLINTKPGTYTVFAELKNKFGATLEKTDKSYITVEDCWCIGDPDCPDKLSIYKPAKPVRAGETITFTANVIGSGEGDNKYEWKVSKGKIIEGQGTPLINVETTPEMAGEKIGVNLKVTDGGNAYCLLEESVTVNIENETPKLDSLTLDKNRAVIGCPPSWYPESTSRCFDKDELLILVATKISGIDDEDLYYYYAVSSGKIFGKGANVIWDLKFAKEGNHTITVGVGKGSIIFGKTLKKTIELFECSSCDEPCECPASVKILGPPNHVKVGDLIVLNAKVTGEMDRMVYNWKISNGTIIHGQGTSQIFVKIDSMAKDTTLEANIELTTDDTCDCLITDLKSFQINK